MYCGDAFFCHGSCGLSLVHDVFVTLFLFLVTWFFLLIILRLLMGGVVGVIVSCMCFFFPILGRVVVCYPRSCWVRVFVRGCAVV